MPEQKRRSRLYGAAGIFNDICVGGVGPEESKMLEDMADSSFRKFHVISTEGRNLCDILLIHEDFSLCSK